MTILYNPELGHRGEYEKNQWNSEHKRTNSRVEAVIYQRVDPEIIKIRTAIAKIDSPIIKMESGAPTIKEKILVAPYGDLESGGTWLSMWAGRYNKRLL